MKKFLIMLMVVAMASFLFVGCLGGGVTPPVDDEDEDEEPVVPTTVTPIIQVVLDAADGYVNAAEAADGILVNGTAPTLSEVKIYIDGICAGTGDVGVTGIFNVVIATDDLGADGAKILHATATDVGLPESDPSNLIEFELDTAAPKIASVRARGGTAAVGIVPQPTYQTFPATVGPPVTPPMFTSALFQAAQLLPGVVNWKIEILSITGTPDIVTVRVHNLTAVPVTFIDYSFNNIAGPPTATSTSWIPGAIVTIAEPVAAGTEVGLNSALHVGAYCLITTTRTGAIRGRVSLTYNEDVSWTQAVTLGNYTIYNNTVGYDVLTGVPLVWAPGSLFVLFMAYNEAADTMFWQEPVVWEGFHLTQGQWLTFQVDTVADVAGNPIPIGSPETANCTILAPTVDIGP
ncbi:MAG: hypothetical protein KAW42_06235 [Candidatus Atribacteria bacterium]|nr:hypothetical protein [Candidatus Atribacteria bacterium]